MGLVHNAVLCFTLFVVIVYIVFICFMQLHYLIPVAKLSCLACFIGEKSPSCEIVLIATILLCRIHQLSHVRKEIKIQTNAGMFPNGERFVNASVSL